jgi:hypothetical protein
VRAMALTAIARAVKAGRAAAATSLTRRPRAMRHDLMSGVMAGVMSHARSAFRLMSAAS